MFENEVLIRLSFFLTVMIIMMLWEFKSSKRKLRFKRQERWFSNLSIVAINSIAVRLLIPFTVGGVAIYAEQYQMGLFNLITVPYVVGVVVSIIALDLIIYVQHVVFHRVPLLWRLHKVHHIDRDIDVTTGLRFHPIEIIISMFIKCVAVLLLGVPFVAVVLFEIILNATSMFNHGNVNLPIGLDKRLRLMVVTPDMHRVHHSIINSELNSNFGFNLPWWDRVFKTYKDQPQKGHIEMIIGLKEYQCMDKISLWNLLVIPFKKEGNNE